MSTQPTLSPLEQLGQNVQQQQSQAAQQTPSSQLSPLEQLGQSVQKQQQVAAKQTADTGISNPNNVPNARIRNLTVDPTKDVHSAGEAFLSGAKTGALYSAIPASVIGLGEAAPVIEHLAESLPTLGKAYQVLKTLGGVASGTGGALYTLQHLKDVLKIIGGGSGK
jgi:hypothetical protein